MNKTIKFSAVITMSLLLLVSCGSAESKIVGQWSQIDSGYFRELEFFSDGHYTSKKNNYSGSYSIDGDRIRLEGILMDDLTFSFEVNGDTLRLYKNDAKTSYYEFERVEE